MKAVADMSMEELAAYVCEALAQEGIETVLSGGCCVEIYSEGRYTSDDIDLIDRFNGGHRKIREVMERLGFREHTVRRYFIHDQTPYFIEFPRGPLGVGDAPVKEIASKRYQVIMITQSLLRYTTRKEKNMPRKPRLEIPGYYHIVNRGVERRVVFKEASDYEHFEALMCNSLKSHGITLHNYCLMPNHYHLLIETSTGNLSKFMRQLNMNYAIYFNKKYNRVGHLWQGRFKSWYVTDEAYLYTLMRYIEQNPLKAA